MISRLHAMQLLAQCVGNEIWSEEFCRQRGLPDEWIDELADCYESGFRHDGHTIYHENRVTNQYRGVRDRDLAVRLAIMLGVDADAVIALCFSPQAEVRALREAVEEG